MTTRMLKTRSESKMNRVIVIFWRRRWRLSWRMRRLVYVCGGLKAAHRSIARRGKVKTGQNSSLFLSSIRFFPPSSTSFLRYSSASHHIPLYSIGSPLAATIHIVIKQKEKFVLFLSVFPFLGPLFPTWNRRGAKSLTDNV